MPGSRFAVVVPPLSKLCPSYDLKPKLSEAHSGRNPRLVVAPNGTMLDTLDNVCHGSAAFIPVVLLRMPE